MIVTGSNPIKIKKFRSYLAKEFEMKDLCALKYFLGMEVSQSKQSLFLLQWKYTLDFFVEIGNSTCEHVDTPIEINHDLSIYSD